MTLKVTITVDASQSYTAKVHTQENEANNGPAKPVERHLVAPGQSRDFYIHSTRSLYVHELPLSATD